MHILHHMHAQSENIHTFPSTHLGGSILSTHMLSSCLWYNQERSLERLPSLSPNIACHFVRLIELLLGSPPNPDCLRYVCEHLLVSDINDLKLVTGPALMETSISVFDGEQVNAAVTLTSKHPSPQQQNTNMDLCVSRSSWQYYRHRSYHLLLTPTLRLQ